MPQQAEIERRRKARADALAREQGGTASPGTGGGTTSQPKKIMTHAEFEAMREEQKKEEAAAGEVAPAPAPAPPKKKSLGDLMKERRNKKKKKVSSVMRGNKRDRGDIIGSMLKNRKNA